MQNKDDFYVAPKDETLKEVAVKTGVSYAKLLKINPHYKDGVPSGAKVTLKIELPEITNSNTEKQEASAKEDKNDKTDLQSSLKETVAEKKPQTVEASFDEEKYQQELAKISSEYSQKEKKLAESFKKSKYKTEEELVGQKIQESSIAEQERKNYGREFLSQKESLKNDYDEKTKKLAQTLGIANKKI